MTGPLAGQHGKAEAALDEPQPALAELLLLREGGETRAQQQKDEKAAKVSSAGGYQSTVVTGSGDLTLWVFMPQRAEKQHQQREQRESG